MASTDAKPIPIKNQAYRVTFPIFDADGDLVTGAAGLDSEVSKDGGAFADCSNEATEIATSSGMYYLDLTADEMNADTVAVIVKTSTSGAKTTPIVLYPAEDADIPVNVEAWNGSAVSALNDPSAAAIADQVWDEALSGHTGAGSAGEALSNAGSGASAADIADAVWDEATADHTGAGSTGEALSNAGSGTSAADIADAVCDEALSGHTAAGSLAKAISDILADTGSDGVAIATATAQAIADEVLKRGVVNVEDAADVLSLTALILAAFKSSIASTTWTIKKSDGVTTFATPTVATDANADPITGVS
jgi:hypothetical protein